MLSLSGYGPQLENVGAAIILFIENISRTSLMVSENGDISCLATCLELLMAMGEVRIKADKNQYMSCFATPA